MAANKKTERFPSSVLHCFSLEIYYHWTNIGMSDLFALQLYKWKGISEYLAAAMQSYL
jgi:hypothetical protein